MQQLEEKMARGGFRKFNEMKTTYQLQKGKLFLCLTFYNNNELFVFVHALKLLTQNTEFCH